MGTWRVDHNPDLPKDAGWREVYSGSFNNVTINPEGEGLTFEEPTPGRIMRYEVKPNGQVSRMTEGIEPLVIATPKIQSSDLK